MRTLTLIFLTFLLSATMASAMVEASQLFSHTQLSSSLSGTTTSGFNFAELPNSAIYGFLGAGFLVITVLRRRKHIYRMRNPRV